jgi:hypothetical protein
VVRSASGRHSSHVELRPPPTRASTVLRRELAELVIERQTLREGPASELALERNRLGIVQAQLELSRALVFEHVGASVA